MTDRPRLAAESPDEVTERAQATRLKRPCQREAHGADARGGCGELTGDRVVIAALEGHSGSRSRSSEAEGKETPSALPLGNSMEQGGDCPEEPGVGVRIWELALKMPVGPRWPVGTNRSHGKQEARSASCRRTDRH